MDQKILDQTHPCYDAARWEALEALAVGGKKFHAMIERFLPKNPMEPDSMYDARRQRARYHSYTGAIISLYASWLFSSSFTVKPHSKDGATDITPAPFYGLFQENVGKEVTLEAFMKERFADSLTKGKSSWLIQLPKAPEGAAPADKAEWEAMGLGRATLTQIDAHELLDWSCDDEGNYEWAILKTMDLVRASPAQMRDTVVETWRIYDRQNVTEFKRTYNRNDQTAAHRAPVTGSPPALHGFSRVPIVTLEIPTAMCIGELTHDPQIAHFRYDAGLDWAIMRTCYAMPVFKIEDADKPPTMGAGYAIMIGMEEEMEWTSPPSDAFQVVGAERDNKREEIFRICHQMAQAVDNNAETVGRSAESKEIDAASTRIMLNAYGKLVAAVIEQTYEIISEARNETNYEWSVEGFSGYDTATAGSLLSNIMLAKKTGIPSQSFQREIATKAAMALLPEVDQKIKDSIRQEIAAYVFEVTGSVIEDHLLHTKLDTDVEIADKTLKSKEKVATKAAAVAKSTVDSGKSSTPK